jgi:hypothetical protein
MDYPMKKLLMLAPLMLLALSACSSELEQPATSTDEANEFAKRINGSNTQTPPSAPPPAASQASAPPAPTVAQPLEGISNAPFADGTVTDPNAACNASRFGEFLGREPNAEVRAAIMEAASDIVEVRFIAPGSDYIKPDPTNPRLNFMIAVDGVIRDIRCG